MPPTRMPRAYLALAEERAAERCAPYRQPESFGYNFRTWVSPYTKGAHCLGGYAIVLQDWASSEGLAGGPDPSVQQHGRTVTLRTNQVLEAMLANVLHVTLPQVYATNAFPFIKTGPMSARIPANDVLCAVRKFTCRELEIAEPKLVLALGKVAFVALSAAGVPCVRLPHPAARIGSLVAHESAWRNALLGHIPGLRPLPPKHDG